MICTLEQKRVNLQSEIGVIVITHDFTNTQNLIKQEKYIFKVCYIDPYAYLYN